MKGMHLAVLALLAVGACAQSVLVLDEKNFDATLQAHPKMMVEFYAPWCGHCKALAPKYDAAAAQLGEKGVLAKVDCTENQELCGRFEVRGYPTLKFFTNGAAADYKKGRSTEEIVNFVLEQNKPSVTSVSSATDLKTFLSEVTAPVAVVAFFGEGATAGQKAAFTSVAEAMRLDGFSFAATEAEDAKAEHGVSGNAAVTIFRKFDEPSVKFEGELTEDNLKKFLLAESFPLFGEIGPENYAKYVERHLPLTYFFLDPSSEAHKEVAAAARQVAPQYKGKLSLVNIDGVQYSRHGESLGVTALPAVVLHEMDSNKKYILNAPITAETLSEFLKGWEAKSLKPFLKTQPVPEQPLEKGVRVLVGSNFESVAFDNTKDVLVEFYAPWCGHCKELAPKYEKLADRFAADSNIVIAKLDATANDVAVNIEGFPTLLFFPAGEASSQGLPYEGERTVDAMAKFINEHRVSSVGAAAASGAKDEL